MKKYLLSFVTGIGIILTIFSNASVVLAETYVPSGELIESAVWNKTGSPYFLEGSIFVPSGKSLTILPGVEVSTKITDMMYKPFIEGTGGEINILGKGRDRILIRDIAGLYFTGSKFKIENADFNTQMGIYSESSTGHIASSTIMNSTYGVNARDSDVKIWGSTFSNIQRAIVGRPSGRQDTFLGLSDDNGLLRLEVTNSSFLNGRSCAIWNSSTANIMARNNWWGTENGPYSTSYFVSKPNAICGIATYAPWLTSVPVYPEEIEVDNCCSSILFIPGLKGTRLLKGTNMLWEPNRNADVEKLALDENGVSLDNEIVAGEPIGKAFGVMSIYSEFMRNLEEFKTNNEVNEVRYYGYDWRKSFESISGDLIEVVTTMAESSKNNKVSIIAHSNGGLVAKELVRQLEIAGKADLIDKVISVAVPFLGTPEAIPAILHGDGQSILGGFVVDKSVGRELGKNMPSAYTLLPSAEFFKKIFSPTIAFASTEQEINRNLYPKNINRFEDQSAFMSDDAGARIAPLINDIEAPLIANKTLNNKSALLHLALDSYVLPPSIMHWALVGWNLGTIKTLNYFEKECFGNIFGIPCKKELSHMSSTTAMGDGTVMSQSAGVENQNTISFDLKRISKEEEMTVKHFNILESGTVQKVLGKLLSLKKGEEISDIPAGVTKSNVFSATETFLVLSTHSPVDLHVYDSKGKHVGLKDSGTELKQYDEEIIGSSFEQVGSETYIRLPENTGEEYKIVIHGTGVGQFTFRAQREREGEVLDTVSFANLPATPFMIAQSSVRDTDEGLASSTGLMKVDWDGNGVTDIITDSGRGDPSIILDVMKKLVDKIGAGNPHAIQVRQKINQFEDMWKKGKLGQMKTKSESIIKQVGHLNGGGVSESNIEQILNAIEVLFTVME